MCWRIIANASARTGVFFRWGFYSCLATLICYLLSFCSPYWVQSWPNVHSPFVRIGLWEACFAGYTHPQDYNHVEHFGCHWIFSKDFWWIREWLMPPWFVTALVLSLLTLVLLTVSTGVQTYLYVIAGKKAPPEYIVPMIGAGTMFFSWLFIILIAILFGVGRNQWDWMWRPDWNFLSWSYWLLCITTVTSFVSAVGCFVYAKELYTSQRTGYGSKTQFSGPTGTQPRLYGESYA